jgi:hypothetical protein
MLGATSPNRSSVVNEGQRTSTTASATRIPFPRLAPVGRASAAWVVAGVLQVPPGSQEPAGQLSASTPRRGTPSSQRCSSRPGRDCALARPRARPPLATTRPLCGRRSRVAERDRFVREAFARPLGVWAVQRGAMPASRAFLTRKVMLAFAMMKRALRSEAGSRPSCAARAPPGPNRRSSASRCGRAAPGR